MKKICLKISYNGIAYSGWQKQKNALSIQENIEFALDKLCNDHSSLFSASRTDAGVHSKAQYATFYTNSSIPARKFSLALNVHLPKDIRIVESTECCESFNPRYDALSKTYIYRIFNHKYSSPIYYDISSHISCYLDINKMQQAAKTLIGTHDFSAFESSGASIRNKIRTIYESDVYYEDDFIVYKVTGSGFLYNMVRIISGTLIDIARNKLDVNVFKNAIISKKRDDLGYTAEAKGLCLENINYGELDPFKKADNETL